MADIILSSGEEVSFDLNAFTITEYREFSSGKMSVQAENEFLSKAAGGLNIAALGYDDWRSLVRAFVEKVTRPLSDPN